MVLLAGLPLVSCSEKIVTVSVSGYNKVSKEASTSLISRYRNRHERLKHLSLHGYFFEIYKKKKEAYIPHYVGSSTTAKFPFTESFARCMLIIHKPWRGSSKGKAGSKLEEFLAFLTTDDCPDSLKLACARAKERHLNGSKFKEPTAGNEESGGNYGFDGIDEQTQDLMELLTTFTKNGTNDDNMTQQIFHRGMNYDWGKKLYPKRDPRKKDGSWLKDRTQAFHDVETSTTKVEKPRVPQTTDKNGKTIDFTVNTCNASQRDILLLILQKLKEYSEFHNNPGTEKKMFTPLRLTIMGQAGTGKSYLINAITAIVRKIFKKKQCSARDRANR